MKMMRLVGIVFLVGLVLFACSGKESAPQEKKEDIVMIKEENKRRIYLAGGCFWGVEGYFQRIEGVGETSVGYANGLGEETSYRELAKTDHAETVEVVYDASRISLEEILLHFFRIIDPTSVNRQGNDVGRQYRTGIYYVDETDLPLIEKVMEYEREKYGTLAVEVEELAHYIPAEEYHQDYLEKNPRGYCHIDLNLADRPLLNEDFPLPSQEQLEERLDSLSYHVLLERGTERAFSSPLDQEDRRGIYVDKITGEPLFSSRDKYDAGCGWPSFTKPILTGKLEETEDTSYGMVRTEVTAKKSGGHLGHVFPDGPKEEGGLRYCINGAALEFIPYEEMEKKGYEEYMVLCE